MVIRFSSVATESMIMLGETAMPLIRMMGASGSIPGAIYGADIPDALVRLRRELRMNAEASALADADDEEDTRAQERNDDIPLAVHALPLVDLLERASAADAAVMWEETNAAV